MMFIFIVSRINDSIPQVTQATIKPRDDTLDLRTQRSISIYERSTTINRLICIWTEHNSFPSDLYNELRYSPSSIETFSSSKFLNNKENLFF